MRLLLVNPYYPISETPSPPLGLAFLAAALEEAGVDVKILDLVVFPYSKELLQSVLNDFSPQMVGITCVTMTFDHAIQVLKDVKSIDSHILTVMGGPHATFCAQETLEAFQELDMIVLGEGEETIVELAREAEKGYEWTKVEGLVYRNSSEIVNTGFRKPIADVDSLPVPARHLLPLGRYRALSMPISMTTSRGCPFRCIFCVGRKMVGPKVRYRNPQAVVDEMAYLNTLNFHQINLADDLFTANKGHCLAVCNEIIDRNLKIEWTSFGRVDTVSMEVLAKMEEAGCHAISFGVESANSEILKTIRKGITTEQVISAVKMCKDAGIMAHISFILGLPGETPETLKETVEFGERLKELGAYHGFHLLAPFPGTEVRQESDKYGIKILTNDWTQYHANRAIVETSSVSQYMLNETVMEWEKEFDERLGEIKRLMERGEATKEEAWQLQKLEHTVLIYDLMMGGVVEEKGFWNNKDKTDSGDALKKLINNIKGSIDYSRKQISETVNFSVEQGYLNYKEEKGQIRWEWVDFL
jgi:radical SAM superfamily enzyme YgiQ (UPF0313 family)